MEIWIPITLAAAAVQTVRFMLQKSLRATHLSTSGATFARFGFGAPLAVLVCALVVSRQGMPEIGVGFLGFAVVGAVAKVVATMATVALFQRRNFAVGLTFAKLEVLVTAGLGLMILGDQISLWAFGAICLGVLGVLALSEIDKAGAVRFLSPSTGLGLSAAFLFGVSGICYRGASFEVVAEDPLLRSSITLAFVTTVQALGMALVMGFREPGQLRQVLRHWRVAGLVGVTSMLGSLGWFTAFTLKDVATVKAVAQIELLFGAVATVFWFKERIALREAIGLGLVAASVLGVVLLA